MAVVDRVDKDVIVHQPAACSLHILEGLLAGLDNLQSSAAPAVISWEQALMGAVPRQTAS